MLVWATRVGGNLGENPVRGTRNLGACLGGDKVREDSDADVGRTGAENEVVGTAPGGIAGATETVHIGHGNGRVCSRCGGLRDRERSWE